MKTIIAGLLSVLFLGGFAQTPQDQEVFKNKVWKVIKVSDSEETFFDKNSKFLGRKIRRGQTFVYQDKWKRDIKVIRIATAPVPAPAAKKPKNVLKNKNAQRKVTPEPAPSNRDLRRAGQTVVRNNKATFYDAQGKPYRTARRRKNKVFFHDEKGNMIGYKIYHKNGSKVYKDPRGRTTGKSHIDKTGKMIYRAKNRNRQTPRIMFEDPFLFSR